MKAANIRRLAVSVCLVPLLNLNAEPMMPEPGWDRSDALQAIHESDTQAVLKPLFQMARNGNNEGLLNYLSAVEQDPDLTSPAIDFIVFSFTTGLSDLDADAVNPAVVDYLAAYEVKTRVADADHPRMTVPLFNVRAAASGLQHHWERQRAVKQSEQLFREPADQWIAAYLASGTVSRHGFVDALELASSEQLLELGRAAVAVLDERPELTLVVAMAGLGAGDFELLQQSITQGGGPGLPTALLAASRECGPEESASLLKHVLLSGPETNAALAIAQLAPNQLDRVEVQDLLFATLADKDLGAAAALVLGASSDPGIRTRLTHIASKKEGLAPQRASMAINSGRTSPEAEQ